MSTGLQDEIIWFQTGAYYASVGRYEQAISCFHRVREINRQSVRAWIAEAYCLDRLDRSAEANSVVNRHWGWIQRTVMHSLPWARRSFI
ncbi:MAG: hypothetical protein LUP99_03400 [Methanomicrobiales archaeon]|nr:hypothetical protein [Methanomicrobiales archaeon]